MITLVLGGTRSGKSAIAEGLAHGHDGPVTYVATAAVDRYDSDHVARIAAHQARRPGHWSTIECLVADELPTILRTTAGVVLLDSLGTWVTLHADLPRNPGLDYAELLAALTAREGPTIVVSEEVGLAVHPPTELGRRYVDAMGTLNQQVAAVAGRVLFVVAGRAIEFPRHDSGLPSGPAPESGRAC